MKNMRASYPCAENRNDCVVFFFENSPSKFWVKITSLLARNLSKKHTWRRSSLKLVNLYREAFECLAKWIWTRIDRIGAFTNRKHMNMKVDSWCCFRTISNIIKALVKRRNDKVLNIHFEIISRKLCNYKKYKIGGDVNVQKRPLKHFSHVVHPNFD